MPPDEPIRLLEIAEPCSVAWREMSGTAARRHCGKCKKDVHSLSDMDPATAAELLSGPAPRGLCVRVRCDSEGFVLHDAPTPRRTGHARLRLLLTPAALSAMAACSAPADSDSSLVVEGPGFTASSVQSECSPARALPAEPSAVDTSTGDTPSAERAIPERRAQARAHQAQWTPAPPTFHFIGVTGPARPPLRPTTQTSTPKALSDQHGHTDSEFDFGI